MRPGATEGPRANEASAAPREVTEPAAETERGTGAGGDNMGRRAPGLPADSTAEPGAVDALPPANDVPLVTGADRPRPGAVAALDFALAADALPPASDLALVTGADALDLAADEPTPAIDLALVTGADAPDLALAADEPTPASDFPSVTGADAPDLPLAAAGDDVPPASVFPLVTGADALDLALAGDDPTPASDFLLVTGADASPAASDFPLATDAERPPAGRLATSRALDGAFTAARSAFAGTSAGFERSASRRASFIAGAPVVGSARFRVSSERASATSEPPRFPPCRDFAIGNPGRRQAAFTLPPTASRRASFLSVFSQLNSARPK